MPSRLIVVVAVNLWVALSAPVHAQDAAEPGGYPHETWLRYADPADAGWSAEGIRAAKAFADSLGSVAVMLVHDGIVVTAWGDVDYHENVHSMSKTFQTVLLGPYVKAGLIDLDASLAELGIDDEPPLLESERRATIRDLLTMRSGVFHRAANEGYSRPKPERGSHEPGTFFFYHNWDMSALNAAFERATGELFQDAFFTKIARPLQMEDYEISNTRYMLSPAQSRLPQVNVRMSARDMARFGLLMLREGSWRGEELVPVEWIRESTEPRVEIGGGNHMGYLWWLPSGRLAQYNTFTASGSGNQSVMILPALDLVFVHRANPLGTPVGGLDAREILFRLIDARVGPATEDPRLVPLDPEAL